MKLCAVEVSTAGKMCFTPYFVTQSTNFWKSYLFRLVIVHTSQLPLKLKLCPWFKKRLKNNHPESSQDHCTVTRLASKMQQCIRLRLHGHTKSCVKISTWRFIMEWMNEWTYCEVVVDELRPAKQVSQPIKGSQLAAQQLLALVVGDGVRATQIIDWSHHSQTCEERKKRQSHIQQLDGFCHWNLTRVFVLKSTLACSALLIVSTDTAGLRSRSHTQPFSSLLTHIECRHASLWCCRVHGRHTGGHEICDLLQSQ